MPFILFVIHSSWERQKKNFYDFVVTPWASPRWCSRNHQEPISTDIMLPIIQNGGAGDATSVLLIFPLLKSRIISHVKEKHAVFRGAYCSVEIRTEENYFVKLRKAAGCFGTINERMLCRTTSKCDCSGRKLSNRLRHRVCAGALEQVPYQQSFYLFCTVTADRKKEKKKEHIKTWPLYCIKRSLRHWPFKQSKQNIYFKTIIAKVCSFLLIYQSHLSWDHGAVWRRIDLKSLHTTETQGRFPSENGSIKPQVLQ